MCMVMSDVISKDIKHLHVGMKISIQAQIPENPRRFSIDLVSSDESVAFHFNPRFNDLTFKDVVVCNTWTPSWLWWKEKRIYEMPFSKNASFEMTITVKNECFEVFVNGNHFTDFEHRLPYHIVKKVRFRGNVYLTHFSYTPVKDPPPYSPNVNTTATPPEP